MTKKLVYCGVTILLGILISSCGQRGPLYLPNHLPPPAIAQTEVNPTGIEKNN